MTDDTNKSIPLPSLKRLPQYLSYLQQLKKKGEVNVSASAISREMNLQQTQVRKDLAFTGVQGVPKVGHRIDELIEAIENFLGWNNVTDAFLVGVGNLGQALMGYSGFKQLGIKIVAAFDTDAKLCGKTLQGIKVFNVEKIPNLANRLHTKIAIIAAPGEAAQQIADILVKSGITAIWNFAPTGLQVPPGIIVENADMYSSLAVLSHKLKLSK